MSKYINVVVTGSATICVEVEDDQGIDQAMDVALTESHCRLELEADSRHCEVLTDQVAIERALRHANEVIKL